MGDTNRIIQQLDELLDYLHATTDVLEEREQVLREENRMKRLSDLKSRASGIRNTLSRGVHLVEQKSEDLVDRVRSMWHEAQDLTKGAAKSAWNKLTPPYTQDKRRTTTNEWLPTFESREWYEFFGRHPNLDPQQWKRYFEGSYLDPTEWRRTIEDSMDRVFPTLSERTAWDKAADYGRRIEGRGERLYNVMFPSDVVAPISSIYFVLFGVYLVFMLRRINKHRLLSGIPTGDGSSEEIAWAPAGPTVTTAAAPGGNATPTPMREAIESNPKHNAISSLKRSLHVLRTFNAIVPLTCLILFVSEMNGLKAKWLHLAYASSKYDFSMIKIY